MTLPRDRLEGAGARWAAELESWVIPDEILAAAPELPWGFPTEIFRASALSAIEEPDDTPSIRRAREALEAGVPVPAAGGRVSSERSVLDVGAGAGAASLPLVPPATRVVAVDESPLLLATLEELAAVLEIPVEVVPGGWPEVAPATPVADVVVCNHVLYNVAALGPFIIALDAHARRRVVIELTEVHPLAYLNNLWKVLHGIERPHGPTAEDALAVVRGLGFDAQAERFVRPSRWGAERQALVALTRRRLCVGPERDHEIDRLLQDGDRGLVTIWWDRVMPSA